LKIPRKSGQPLGIAVLGSTGSVGRQTLDVIDAHPEHFRVISLAAKSGSEAFLRQVARYKPVIASVADLDAARLVKTESVHVGFEGLIAASIHSEVDIVVVATSGHDAIKPTMAAIEHGKIIALANKETLVCAGELIMPLAARNGAEIRPVDSEHSAIWQAMGTTPKRQVSRIVVTASGGPFRETPMENLQRVSVSDALAHPTWSMGGKITIDSATLMNKGLEVIEAHWLFGLPYEMIEVVVHPESIIHSLVEFIDGSQIAQLGLPDMRLPIQYALGYPERLPSSGRRLSLPQVGSLRFEPPDEVRFPSLRLAREAGIAGSTYPTVLSAADDVAVSAFLNHEVRFLDIPRVVQRVVEHHRPTGQLSLEAILVADEWARGAALDAIRELRARS